MTFNLQTISQIKDNRQENSSQKRNMEIENYIKISQMLPSKTPEKSLGSLKTPQPEKVKNVGKTPSRNSINFKTN